MLFSDIWTDSIALRKADALCIEASIYVIIKEIKRFLSGDFGLSSEE